jgi:hypothetical protein
MKKIAFIILCILPFFTFAQDTLVKWTFPNNPDDSIEVGSIPADTGMMISAHGGTSAMNFTTGGATTYCASATKWTTGNGTKFWQIKVVTLNYNNIQLSSKQYSSATGPQDFKSQYMMGYGGTWNDFSGNAVTVATNWTSGKLVNVPLPSACNNQDTVYIRWIMTSDNAVNGSAVVNTGSSKIDDIFIRGVSSIDITHPTVLGVYATSLSTIKVRFSEAVNTTAENIANYTGLVSISSAVRNATLDTVLLTLATPLQSGIPDTLTISNVQDTSGNPMAVPQSFPVIFGALADTTHPTVLTAYATGLTQVKVKFSEAVDTSAENTANYTGLGTISSAVRSASKDTVTITLSAPLVMSVPDTLTIANILDTTGNAMQYSQQFPIMWGNANNQNIVITEIMYNPPESGTDSLEFIELYNNGSSSVALKDFYFSAGVTYTFHNDTIQPNSFYLVAVDSMKFHNFYNKTAHKWKSGAFSNSGAAIVIKDNFGVIVDSVYYKTTSPWPTTAANGNGSSLMLCNPSSDNNVGTNWVASGATNATSFGIVNTKQVYATPGSSCMTIIPPAVMNAYATSLSSVKIVFNKPVNTTAENIANYTGLISISSAVRNATLDTVLLTLATPLQSGIPDTLTISNIHDTSDNPMAVPQSFPIIFGAFADTTHPTVLTAYATGLTQVKVKFSEAVDASAENTANYTGLGTISSAIRSISMDTVTLTLSISLVMSVPDTLTIANVSDTTGNAMQYSPQFQIMWGNVNNQNIVITEIMYNPPESGTDSLEFIELYNNGSSAVALKDFYFSLGVVYTFHSDTIQPNDYYLVAVDSVVFSNFYNKTAHQWTSGTLSNSGEAIVIKDNFNILVDSVYYHTSAPWPTAANGNGSSLMLCDPSSDNSVAVNWVASDSLNATSFGIVNTKQVYATPDSSCHTGNVPSKLSFTAINAGNSVYVNQPFSATIELLDNSGNPTIAASNVNITLSRLNGSGTLSGTVTGTIVSGAGSTTISGMIYNTLETGVTLKVSDDASVLVSDTSSAFDVLAVPPPPPIVITEIMYNSPESGTDTLEFIELYNNGSSQENLGGFYFTEGFVYTFPANTIINPGSYLVLARKANAVDNFYGISSTLQWTSGTLVNSGSKIELVTSTGDAVDSLTYKPSGAWPTSANGNGSSLMLCSPFSDNSVAANWVASGATNATSFGIVNTKHVYATPGKGCTTGIEDQFANNYYVDCFPNPVSEVLALTIRGQAKEIVVFDLIGNIVYKTSKLLPVTTINTEKLNNGIYFIKIIFNDNTIITKKISVI